jgi:peptidyl-dipeptidase A
MHPFQHFLNDFIPILKQKSILLNKATWILETTGSPDASEIRAFLDTDLRLLFNNAETYDQLLLWDQDKTLKDSLLKRELEILIRMFKPNMVPKALLELIANKEAAISYSYATFRPKLKGKNVSENDIREILKNEKNPLQRQHAWEASKEVGEILSSQILELVELRNQSAHHLGYSNYFEMQLDLQEIEDSWLLDTFSKLADDSETAYKECLELIKIEQSNRFGVSRDQLGPWAWSEPFCQEDPINTQELDNLISEIDLIKTCTDFYDKMGFSVQPILDRSDMYERAGKNQHAFCFSIDRYQDVRMLNNMKQTIKWLETLLHELGHGIYDISFKDDLPWLLREPSHTLTTEAMALIAGRQAYRADFLRNFIPVADEDLLRKAEESLRRRQLVFSRWVLVMTFFEKELYRNPKQNLNILWWKLVEQFQKIQVPTNRENKWDWACKYHIANSPVYYYSYLLGELLASQLQETFFNKIGTKNLDSKEVGSYLKEKLFSPGKSIKWSQLVSDVTGQRLKPDAWISEFTRES